MPYLVPDTWLWGYRQGGLHGQCGSGQGRELLGNCRDHKMATCIIILNEKKSSMAERKTLGAEHWTVCQG